MHLDRQVVSFWGFAKHESMLLLLSILYYSTTERIFKASNTSELTFLKLPCWLAVLSANGHSDSIPFSSLHHSEAEALKHMRTIMFLCLYLQRPG